MGSGRIHWRKGMHEAAVERFYSTGAEDCENFHGGYLNFGLWEKDVKGYVRAAERLVTHLATLANLNRKSRVLDVACGRGVQDVLMHKKFGCEIDAVDITWKHVVSARRHVEQAGIQDKVRVHHGTATNLPFNNCSFTHAISIEGPEHFNTRERFFQEAYRVLKPRGVIGMADYTLKRRPNNVWDRFIVRTVCALWHVPKANIDTLESYKRKLERTGFKNVMFEEVGALVIPGYYFEQQRKKTKQQLRKVRGWFATYPGSIIDHVLYKMYKDGLLEYIFVRAEK